MNAYVQPRLDFEAVESAAADGEALIVALGPYEGPLHVLLDLARSQKVDLLQISIARLAEQYLAFVRAARSLRFALAAEYLVMAAWLAFLKSRLLLPKAERPPEPERPAEEMAARLAFGLARLDAMRRAAEALAVRPQLNRDVFMRGDPEVVKIVSRRRLEGDLLELMTAYAEVRTRDEESSYRPQPVEAYRLDDARERLRTLLPSLMEWTTLTDVAPSGDCGAPSAASRVASTLSAALELAREGDLELRQAAHFDPLYMRASMDA
ncbi:MAG TPA: ScpA family protein [Caulobacteraceae bacterium]